MNSDEDFSNSNRSTKGREIFQKIIEPESGDIRDTLYKFIQAAVIAVATIFSLLVLLAIIFQGTDKIGQAGDFFGGFLNPLLTFLTFSGVLFTVYIQRQDLSETRKETQRQAEFFERQNFESTFFQMLNLHNEIVNALELEEFQDSPVVRGRGCFRLYYARLSQAYDDNAYARADGFEQEGMDVAVQHAFDRFWAGNRQDLGHYFRFLYNIIRYVDESIIPASAHEPHDLKMRYMKLLRAQLSDYELLIIFYNSITGSGTRFISYINRYELLDNMPRDLAIRDSHLTDFPNIVIREEPLDK